MSKIIRLNEVYADPTIVELMDMSYFNTKQYLESLVPPKPDHLLVLTRPFTEDEKNEIYTQLEFQRVTNSINLRTQNEVYREIAMEKDILLSDFNYIPFQPRKVA